MRILHVTPYFEDAWAYGGIPRAAAATVRGLAARGHDVTVCTTDACRPDARLAARTTPLDRERAATSATAAPSRAVDVKVFPNLSNRAAYHLQFFVPRGMDDYLRHHAGTFDVAHLHGCHHIPGALAARHLRRAEIPYVLTPHGTAPYLEGRRFAKRLFDATIGRGVLEGAARVVAVSAAERAQLVHFGVPTTSISVIPNAVDVTEFADTPRGLFRRRFDVPVEAPVVLFLGKLTAQKRLDVLVEAFASLPRPEARLVIAGNDMGYGPALRGLIRHHGIERRTMLTGLLPGPQRVHALADADVVVYASEGEVFGLVAVEALLCGTPVIVSNDSGCGEVVHQVGGGLLVPPGDAGALRAALDEVLSRPRHWRSAAEDACLRARRFASDEVCVEIESVYARVMARAPHAARHRVAV